jgi:CheY-like chemotaxis protein
MRQVMPARVLVCEDQQEMSDALASFLRAYGHDVLACDNGKSAMDQAPVWQPGAAIIDIGLPDVTGYAVAQHMRELSFGSDLLLVALTAYAHPSDLEMARYAGFHWHFAKPARFAFIVDVLANPYRKPNGRRDGTPLNRYTKTARAAAV